MIHYLTSKEKYQVIKPYVNFGKSASKRRINLYYNTLIKYISNNSTRASFNKNSKIHRNLIASMNYDLYLSGLEKIPVPPSVDMVTNNITKIKLIFKKNYAVYSSKHMVVKFTSVNPTNLVKNPDLEITKKAKSLGRAPSISYSFIVFNKPIKFFLLNPITSTKILIEDFKKFVSLKYEANIISIIASLTFK